MEFVLNEYHRNITDEEMLTDIVRVANKLGRDTLTEEEYRNNGGKYHWSTVTRRFGGWVNALQKSGLSPEHNQLSVFGISKEKMIEDLLIVASKLNKKSFTTSEYEKNGSYSVCLFQRRFGSWSNALAFAGLEPSFPKGQGEHRKITVYQCLEEIERIWIELGRQPTTTDIKNGISIFSLHAYERRFGSWRKALEYFVAYMNGEQEVEQPTDSEDSAYENHVVPKAENTENKDEFVHKTKRDIGLRTRFLVMKRDDFKCCMCGRSPATTHGLELHIDHIIPWSKGGETVIDNLQTLCSDCNLGKGNLHND